MEDQIDFHPSISCKDQISSPFNVLPLYWNTTYNSRYAKGFNDGPAWQGRGINSTLGFGFSGRIGRLTYVLNPVIHFAENRSFYVGSDLTIRPDYQYPYSRGIDYVSRYGEDPMAKLYPGQSEISLNLNPVEVSLSTQNMRWGPAIYNPVIMSTNAPGIPHLRIGTSRPVKTGIGDWEGNIYWGLLRESEYFNADPDDDLRYFAAINIGYRPGFFEGLSIGIHRVFYTQKNYLSSLWYDGFIVFSRFFSESNTREVNGSLTNDYYDQLLSVSLSWKSDDDDFSIFIEWAREDFAGGFVALMEQYERQSGFSAGLKKIFRINNERYVRFIYEHTALATWKGDSFGGRFGSFYTHSINRQGYTNNGQIIGAFAGPGAQADMLNVAYVWNEKSITFEYQRARYNDDYFYTTFTEFNGPTPQDLEHQLGLRFSDTFQNISYSLGSFIGVRDNYLFNDETVLVNMHSNLSLRYSF